MIRNIPILLSALLLPATVLSAAERPNILWISCEDIGPHLGCYGCAEVKTPTLDALAARGVRYTNAFVVCPVCATNRSAIITGMYPTTLGTHHMRSDVKLPDDVKCFSEYLRQAGYYCANNAKTDYNFAVPKGAWDESSAKAHWRNRKSGQPFFFVRNFTNTHESRIWPGGRQHVRQTPDLKPADRLDPARLKVPPYHPNEPEARRDWANYFENIVQLDYNVARLLKELEQDGLANDTIIFFWSDHGPGLPRCKRWLYDSGMRVPLIVVIPEKFRVPDQAKSGTVDDQLVSSIDFAPTVLTLCGVQPAKNMQGRAFLGPNLSPPRQYVIGTRDRMDERADMIRTVRDKRYRYIRNYMPWRPYAQWISYAERNATMQELRRQVAAGDIRPRQQQKIAESAAQWNLMADTKRAEELYDTQTDPHEINNLVISATPEDMARLREYQEVLDAWQLETRDLGLLPEAIVAAEEKKAGHRRGILRTDEGRQRIAALQKLLWTTKQGDTEELLAFDSADPAVRWWSVWKESEPLLPTTNWGIKRPRQDSKPIRDPRHEARLQLVDRLRPGLKDESVDVRVAVAEIIGKLDNPAPAVDLLIAAARADNPWTRLAAVTALDELGEQALAARPTLEKCLSDPNGYVSRVAARALEKAKTAKPVPAGM